MERIRLTLEAGPDPLNGGRDAHYRLKLVLKRLLRSYGFCCVAIEAEPGESAVVANAPHPPISTTRERERDRERLSGRQNPIRDNG